MHETADVWMRGERVEHGVIAHPRFQRTEADAVGSHRACPRAGCRVCPQGCEGGQHVGEPVPRIAVEREVAAGDDDFPVAGGKEGLGTGEDLGERDRARSAAKGRDDAECAEAGTSVLYLKVGAGGAERDWR